MSKIYSLGIDVGSTTVKTVITNENGEIIYSKYQRHFSKVKETAAEQVREIAEKYPDVSFTTSVTGSAGLGLANAGHLPFVQEVYAAFVAINRSYPDADAAIELGGEDAKIIYFEGGNVEREDCRP